MKFHCISFDYNNSNDYERLIYVLKQSVESYGGLIEHKVPSPSEKNKINSNYNKIKYQIEILKNEKEPFVFIDGDTVLLGDISNVFDDDFDIAFTERSETSPIPINVGVVFCRPSYKLEKFFNEWYEAVDFFYKNPDELKPYLNVHKGICQSGLGKILEKEHDLKIKYLPCSIYNACEDDWKDKIPDDCKVIHLKNESVQKQLLHGGSLRYPHINRVFFKYKTTPSTAEMVKFKKRTGYNLDIINPKTFNEKIAWKKHNDRNPLIVETSDKVLVRNYVKEKGFNEILTELLYIAETPKDIKVIPGCVLKSSHGSGQSIIMNPKMSKISLKTKVKKFLKGTYNSHMGEWAYQLLKPQILVEKMISDTPASCIKALCFHGSPKYFYYQDYDINFKPISISLYDDDWVLQNVKMNSKGISFGSPLKNKLIDKPVNLNYIKEVCCKLSEDFQFVRVDLMVVDDKIYFSELTHYPTCGMMRFEPQDWDLKLGELWDINKKVES